VGGVDVFLLRPSVTAGDSTAVPEAHRFLSAEGRQIVRALGNRVRTAEALTFDRMITSPMAAAAQTAELFADRVDYVGVIEVLPALATGVPPEVAAPLVLAQGESIVVVADEPALSNLGAFLIGRPTFPPLLRGQLSVIHDRQPAWCLRPGELARSLLLVA
jgi:phosphohistidine phosphatase SixA